MPSLSLSCFVSLTFFFFKREFGKADQQFNWNGRNEDFIKSSTQLKQLTLENYPMLLLQPVNKEPHFNIRPLRIAGYPVLILFKQFKIHTIRFGRTRALYEALACDCSIDSPGGDCYDNVDAGAVTAITLLCSSSNLNLKDVNYAFEFKGDSVSSGECVLLIPKEVSADNFEDPPRVGIATFLLDFSDNKPFSFKNGKKSTIGQVAEDGFSIEVCAIHPLF